MNSGSYSKKVGRGKSTPGGRKTPLSKKNIQETSSTTGWDDVPGVPVYSEKELAQEVDQLAETLKDSSTHDWDQRVAGLVRIQALVEGGAAELQSFHGQFRKLINPISAQVSDLRSKVLKQGCKLLNYLAAFLANDFEPYAVKFLPSLFKLVQNSKLAIWQPGDHCIRNILTSAFCPRLITPIAETAITSKNNAVRSRCAEYIELVFNTPMYTSTELARHMELLEKMIKKCVRDAAGEARAAARRCFWGFSRHFAEDGKRLVSTFDANTQQLIHEEFENSATMSNNVEQPAMQRTSKGPKRATQTPGRSRAGRVAHTTNADEDEENTNAFRSSGGPGRVATTANGPGRGVPSNASEGTSRARRVVDDVDPSWNEDHGLTGASRVDASNVLSVSLDDDYEDRNDPDELRGSAHRFDGESSGGPRRVATAGTRRSEADPRKRSGERAPMHAMRVLQKNEQGVEQQPQRSREGGSRRVLVPATSRGEQAEAPSPQAKRAGRAQQSEARAASARGRTPSSKKKSTKRPQRPAEIAAPEVSMDNEDVESFPELMTKVKSSIWANRVEAFEQLGAAARGEGCHLRPSHIPKVVDAMLKAIKDPHYKVVMALLEAVAEFFFAFSDAMEKFLEMLLPDLLRRRSDPKQMVQERAELVFKTLMEVYEVDSIIATLVKIMAPRNTKVRVASLVLIRALLPQSKESFRNGTNLRQFIERVVVMSSDKDSSLRSEAIGSLVDLHNMDSELFLRELMLTPMKVQLGVRRVLEPRVEHLEERTYEAARTRARSKSPDSRPSGSVPSNGRRRANHAPAEDAKPRQPESGPSKPRPGDHPRTNGSTFGGNTGGGFMNHSSRNTPSDNSEDMDENQSVSSARSGRSHRQLSRQSGHPYDHEQYGDRTTERLSVDDRLSALVKDDVEISPYQHGPTSRRSRSSASPRAQSRHTNNEVRGGSNEPVAQGGNTDARSRGSSDVRGRGGNPDVRGRGGTDVRGRGSPDVRGRGSSDVRGRGGSDVRSRGGTDVRRGGTDVRGRGNPDVRGTDVRSRGGTDVRSRGSTDVRNRGSTDVRSRGDSAEPPTSTRGPARNDVSSSGRAQKNHREGGEEAAPVQERVEREPLAVRQTNGAGTTLYAHDLSRRRNAHSTAEDPEDWAHQVPAMLNSIVKNASLDGFDRIIAFSEENPKGLWEQYFGQILLVTTEAFKLQDPVVREIALVVLDTMLLNQSAFFLGFVNIVIQKLLEAYTDRVREVHMAAERALGTLADNLPPQKTIEVLIPLILSEDGSKLAPSIRMLTRLIPNLASAFLAKNLSGILPGLFEAFRNTNADVRKAVVFALVELYMMLGDGLTPFLSELTTSQLKLVTIYINRRKAQSEAVRYEAV